MRDSEPSSAQSHFTKILFEFEDSIDELETFKHRRVGSLGNAQGILLTAEGAEKQPNN
jgi:hypothetical protein